MLVSIIIPVYNGEKFLRGCLESVRVCQSSEVECIIVNDGSTDSTETICKSFTDKDIRFRLINKKNSGVSDSRNTGIAEATGKYVFFLDADDYIETSLWQEIVDTAVAGTFDMAAFGYNNLFESGDIQPELFPEGISIEYALLSTTLLNACWGKLFRRDIIKANNLLFRKELKTCEDAIFVLDFVRCAKEFMLSNSLILCYRIHSGGVMQQTSLHDKLSDFAGLFVHRKEYLEENYEDSLNAAMYRQSFSVITDLLRSYVHGKRISEISRNYRKSLANETVKAIMAGTHPDYLSPIYKKIEFMLMQREFCTVLAVYFKIKCALTTLKVRRVH